MHIAYEFVPMGYVTKPEKGKVYIDAGNAFCPGILDHHHPDAPDTCTAMLTLHHPEFVRSQIHHGHLTIIPHVYPDLDALTGAYFARMIATSEAIADIHHAWAAYVCKVDQGFTTLTPAQPVIPYSLFMMRMQQLRLQMPDNTHAASLMMLQAGFKFLDTIFDWLNDGGTIHVSTSLVGLEDFTVEITAITDDLEKYQCDMEKAELFSCLLPKKDEQSMTEVAGLWIEFPESAMFKSWARGDAKKAGNEDGFVFLGIQLGKHRFILSVDPSSDVYLKGLGDLIEQAEMEKRRTLGMERQGENRPGYDSPDPWYDGRSPLHHYTIIDSPRVGTILNAEEVRNIFRRYWEHFGHHPCSVDA